MIGKKVSKIIGLKKEEFDDFLATGQIIAQEARLIPVLKTGDEMALTSIFLSALRLIKEYRESIFKEIKFSRAGRAYYYTEISFPGIGTSRVDGIVLNVVSGVIRDAVFFEMKNKNNSLTEEQVEAYIKLSRTIGVNKIVTVSNEFVADPTQSPLNMRVPKSFGLYHFSWTYLLIKGQLLLFKNEDNIEDHDQVELMKEVLFYLENPVSGVKGYTQMKPGWKELAENIRAHKPLKLTDQYIEDAVLSWYEEERDMALLMSRKLGVMVKPSQRVKNSLKNDIRRVVKDSLVLGRLSVKNSVSDIRVVSDFERRTVSMSVNVTPPMNKGTIARITWVNKQLENCNKKSEEVFTKLTKEIWIEAKIKYAKTHIMVSLNDLNELPELAKGKEIQSFNISLIKSFSSNFASNKKFIELIEDMILQYYEGIVQHMTNWSAPAPKIRS